MDCKKKDKNGLRYAWAGLVFGSALTLTTAAFWSLPLSAGPQAETVVEEERFDGTTQPDDIPGFARTKTVRNREMNDFDALDPDAPVAIPQMLDAGFQASDDQENKAVADASVSVQSPARLRPGHTKIDEVRPVQYSLLARAETTTSTAPATQRSGMPVSEYMAALKEQLESVLAQNAKRGISMASNTPCDIMIMAQPYGVDAMVFQPSDEAPKRGESQKGGYIYSIGSLAWNYACGGKRLLKSDGKRIYAKIGNGYQNKPSQFLALLAMSNIRDNYEIRIDGMGYTIADLVTSEKAACRSGHNHALTLVGLAFYAQSRDQWKSDNNENWSIERLVASELNRPVDQSTSEATDWLLGLTAAVELYNNEGARFTPTMNLARQQILTYHEFVLSIQNEHGLWHPEFFMKKGVGGDHYETLYASGHILRFLALSLPEKELSNPKMTKAVQALATRVAQVPQTANAVTMTDRQTEGLSVALHALAIYNQRMFQE